MRGVLPDSGLENKGISVGSYLREKRISRGVELDDAARITRIGKNYLSALEEERFDTLPNPAYVKGFLRAYASFLGLSGDEVIAIYERAGLPAALEIPNIKAKVSSMDPGKSVIPRKGLWVVPLFLLVLVIGAAYLFKEKESVREKAPSAPSSVPMTAGPAPVQQSLSSAVKAAGTTPLPAEKAGNASAQSGIEPPPEGIVLKLKANQDSSLNVTIDGTVSQEYDLKAGDIIEWKADTIIALDMGNAGGMEAELNGKPLKPFGAPGKSAHVELKADAPAP